MRVAHTGWINNSVQFLALCSMSCGVVRLLYGNKNMGLLQITEYERYDFLYIYL